MIPLFKVFMADSVGDAVNEVLYSGFIGEGPKVIDFEEKLKSSFKNKNVLTVNAGTSALHIAYHIAIDHFNDAEIITPSMTCTATNTPIIANGAKIVWADVDPLTGNIDPNKIENLITKKTKAIVAVHWGGNPAKLNEIHAIAKKYDVKVIEDAAHAMGSIYKGNPIGGGCSDFTAFSFQAIKHLTTIDGGALACKSEIDYDRAKLLRWFGIDRNVKDSKDLRCEIDVKEAGYKFHMNDVNAVVGLKNIEHLDYILDEHKNNALFYNQELSNFRNKIQFAEEEPDSISSYWLYTIHLNNRDEVMAKLKDNNIMSSKVHSCNHPHTMFKSFISDLPNTQKFEKTHLCIPVGWWVSKDDRQKIIENVVKFAR